MGQRCWDRAEKHFVTSLDFGLTEPSALEFLSQLPRSSVRVANPVVLGTSGLRPLRAYHPKLYLFDSADAMSYVVGSANLTESALVSNTEVVAAGRDRSSNNDWDQLWQDLLLDTAPLTTSLVEDYRRRWKQNGRRPAELDRTPRPPAITPRQLPVFSDAVAGGLSPITFDHFWVEAGSMSSGGSHNQLELPRGANRFFGFNHSTYGNAHVTIGHPQLTLRGRSWSNRPLTWHGNNGMERMNLPTVAQGGDVYANTAVLFRRHATGFEIATAPWGDGMAAAWRAASDTMNLVFRLGERGGRICGLF